MTFILSVLLPSSFLFLSVPYSLTRDATKSDPYTRPIIYLSENKKKEIETSDGDFFSLYFAITISHDCVVPGDCEAWRPRTVTLEASGPPRPRRTIYNVILHCSSLNLSTRSQSSRESCSIMCFVLKCRFSSFFLFVFRFRGRGPWTFDGDSWSRDHDGATVLIRSLPRIVSVSASRIIADNTAGKLFTTWGCIYIVDMYRKNRNYHVATGD